MFFKIFICLAFSISAISVGHAACLSRLPVHEIREANNSVLRVTDEAGARDIKAVTYSINGCQSDENSTTGSKESVEGTWLSHVNLPSGNACLQVVVSSYRVLVSFQAVVVRANSWTLQPKFTIDGISAESGASSALGYKETAAVFGIKNKSLVSPTITLNKNSFLSNFSYIVPAWASKAMGLEIGAVMASGAEYKTAEYKDCALPENKLACQVAVSFTEHIDALVVIFALAQRATSTTTSTAVMSEIMLGCGCRCRISDFGTRLVTSSVFGQTNQCVRKESTAPLTECDVFGDKWCDQKPNEYYEINGPKLANGNYPCTVQNNYVAEYFQEFSPATPF